MLYSLGSVRTWFLSIFHAKLPHPVGLFIRPDSRAGQRHHTWGQLDKRPPDRRGEQASLLDTKWFQMVPKSGCTYICDVESFSQAQDIFFCRSAVALWSGCCNTLWALLWACRGCCWSLCVCWSSVEACVFQVEAAGESKRRTARDVYIYIYRRSIYIYRRTICIEGSIPQPKRCRIHQTSTKSYVSHSAALAAKR